MNRTFQSKVRWHQIFLLLLLTGLCIYMIWYQYAIISAILAIFMIVLIERIIHTEYTITDNNLLIIRKGRYTKTRQIPLSDITDIEIKTTSNVGGQYLLKYILLTLKGNEYIGITPTNVEECYKVLVRKKENYNM